MILLNKTTGIVEYDGPCNKFLGLAAYEHSEVEADFEIRLTDAEKMDVMRSEITNKAGDQAALLGTASDATLISIDNLAIDVLAMDKSANSSYKEARIEFYEHLHGKDAWSKAVVEAKQWFEGRKAGVIRSPVDVKGGKSVFAKIAQRATAVADILANVE